MAIGSWLSVIGLHKHAKIFITKKKRITKKEVLLQCCHISLRDTKNLSKFSRVGDSTTGPEIL